MSRKHFNREVIHEFRRHLTAEVSINPATDAVVVLSIRPPHNSENTERIRYGWELAQRVAALRAKKESSELSLDDLERFAPIVVLNAESECLEDILETALGVGILPTKIFLLDCGSLASCNTKTNMEVILEHPELSQYQHLTFVTSGYHAPRVARTANQHLPDSQKFDVFAVPHGRFDYNVTEKVRAEIRRMKQYHDKGDIAASGTR